MILPQLHGFCPIDSGFIVPEAKICTLKILSRVITFKDFNAYYFGVRLLINHVKIGSKNSKKWFAHTNLA